MPTNTDNTNSQENLAKLLYGVRLGLIKKVDALITVNDWDINASQLRTLSLLDPDTPSNPSELAKTLVLNGGALTRILDGLLDKGYVSRTANAQDRRVIDVCRTAAGQTLWLAIEAKLMRLNTATLGVLTPAEQVSLFAYLHRVWDHLDSDDSL